MIRPCPLCSGPGVLVAQHATSVTSGSQILSAPSTLFSCGLCGHVFTWAAVDWEAYYATKYDATLTDGGMDEIVSAPDGTVAFRTDVDYGLFRSIVGDRLSVETSVLEYGCGRGRILSRLVRDGFDDVDGFDLSESYRASVAPIIGDHRVHIGKRPEGQWDLAISFFVFEHDVDPLGSLRYLRRVIKPNSGHLFFMVPNPTTNLGDFACADHVHHFIPDVLVELVESVGFEVVTLDTSSIGASAVLLRTASKPRSFRAGPLRVERTEAMLAPYRAFKERLDRLPSRIDKKRPLYLYGAGFYATMAFAELTRAGIEIAGVFDANDRKHGETRLGRVVDDPEGIPAGSFHDASLLVCINERAFPSVRDKWARYFSSIIPL